MHSMSKSNLINNLLSDMDHHYGIILHLCTKTTYSERITTETFKLIYQNIYQLCPVNKNYSLIKLI